ncbi:hypothetical protein HanPI659440_Chr05g0213801 [Helianthus annuus]|nr:hypothetical protein HanPI659440_Chr05g0213801 [Helianthus annuus]
MNTETKFLYHYFTKTFFDTEAFLPKPSLILIFLTKTFLDTETSLPKLFWKRNEILEWLMLSCLRLGRM